MEQGRSRKTAFQHFLINERSLQKKDKWDSFHRGVTGYLETGHAEKVPSQEMGKPHSGSYYLPMHGVEESSTTTKLRIVFDASAKSSNDNSLNDVLLTGPSLYPLFTTIINRFRLHRIGMSGDISKMFQEVGLYHDDFDLHRFLHKDASGEIADCRMKRLTFGVTTSSFWQPKS